MSILCAQLRQVPIVRETALLAMHRSLKRMCVAQRGAARRRAADMGHYHPRQGRLARTICSRALVAPGLGSL